MTGSTGTTDDYYRLLGLSPDATLEEIRAAYRDRVRLYHPDLVAGNGADALGAATEMTAQINRAYECLSDPERRSAYDNDIRADAASSRRPSTVPLVVTPRMLRCHVIPGDTVRLDLSVQSESPSPGGDLRVYVEHRWVAANFTVTSLDVTSARLQVKVNTSRLADHRSHQIPIVVTWGGLTGTATLTVRTDEPQGTGSPRPPRPEPASTSRRHWTRPPDHRTRDLVTVGLGGIVVPLLMLAWASGALSDSTPVIPPLVATFSAAVVFATIWFLTSSRLLRQPDRLTRVGVIWGHLMRWSGWSLVGSGAVALGIPVAIGVFTLIGIIAAPFLGLAVIAIISAIVDSRDR